jgi:putative copper resistance protein D
MILALGAARFVHFAALTFLFGALLFPLYAFGRDERSGSSAMALTQALRTPCAWAGAMAIVSGLAWFCASVGAMAGDPAASIDASLLIDTARNTGFGALWIVRMIAAAALAGFLILPGCAGRVAAETTLAAVLLGSLALTGHAWADQGWQGWLHAGADAVHLLSAGFWVGALVALMVILRRAARAGGAPDHLGLMLGRFSSAAVVAVVVLIASGIINTALMIASPLDLLRTAWGRVLLVKLALVAAMLALAAVNRNVNTPSLRREGSHPLRALRWLRRNTLAEAVLAAGVLIAVSALGLLDPVP